ncbi:MULTISPECIES: hypothetical protein [unclassified Bradyrhizobium]|uniref:hypothetical protein n=1 Tax=unclassified Bradyrhizobium TaxID=2631580 RepID=UPI002915DF13|nr:MULTISPECIES: hypothetical protein [unclassified Bradyrhizobium]
MTEAFSKAHRRLDRILRFFLVTCVAGVLVGLANRDLLFAAVWLAACFLDGLIGFEVRKRGGTPPTSADNEFVDSKLLSGSITNFSNLVAGSILLLGLVMQQPWWAVLMATAAGWCATMLMTMLICMPHWQA